MLRRVALVRTDVSEELSASFIRVTRIGELGTLVVTSNRRTLRRNAKYLNIICLVICPLGLKASLSLALISYGRTKLWGGARGSVVLETICHMPEGRGFRSRWGNLLLSIYQIPLAAPGPEIYSTSNRNEYREQKQNMFLGNRARLVRENDNLTAVSEPTV
jgi:hypothetical protein